jgi:hypothetical protein
MDNLSCRQGGDLELNARDSGGAFGSVSQICRFGDLSDLELQCFNNSKSYQIHSPYLSLTSDGLFLSNHD